jgi:hypothetical protein
MTLGVVEKAVTVDKYSICEWLEYNRLTLNQVHRATAAGLNLARSNSPDEGVTKRSVCSIKNPIKAWNLVANSMSRYFSAHSELIEAVSKNTTTCFISTPSSNMPASTIDEGKPKYPRVTCPFSGTADDLITMAHEFAHAVQIMASTADVTPPVHREISAFVGELVFIDYCKKVDNRLHQALKSTWKRQNRYYLCESARNVRIALAQAESSYEYSWNYPVARVLASRLFESSNSKELWELFEKGSDSGTFQEQLAALVAMPASFEVAPIPDKVPGDDILQTFRALGTLLFLDILYQGKEAEKAIDVYTADTKNIMAGNGIFLAITKSRQPIGYCRYEKLNSNNDSRMIRTTLEVSPLGRQLELQEAFKNAFGSTGEVEVLHAH